MSTGSTRTPEKEAELKKTGVAGLDDIYEETAHWEVNLGEKTIHAKRIPGKFRKLKWFTASLYLVFFLGPFLRWEGRQAVLFDIPERKYHIFSLTIWPQDIWMLALILIIFFISLYAATSLAGRVFCGYFCWQTVWTDMYTWIEEKLEGPPQKRRQLDSAPWDFRKISIKGTKHLLFLLLGALTGITFTAYFIDVFELWNRYFSLQGPLYIWITPLPFLIGSYLGVAFMREQVCFWLCPYARLQSVMTDVESLIPTYDVKRGEPRSRFKAGKEKGPDTGDCIDCNLCYAVCPTGVDIRHGMQEGCITCGFCIDACDSIMEKVNRPKGLIRYASQNEMQGMETRPFYKRGRVLVYFTLILACLGGIIYGASNISPLKIGVTKERQPVYVRLKDGSIQNKFTLKLMNKTDAEMKVTVSIDGFDGAKLDIAGKEILLEKGKVLPVTALVKANMEDIHAENSPLYFEVNGIGNERMRDRHKSAFSGPVN